MSRRFRARSRSSNRRIIPPAPDAVAEAPGAGPWFAREGPVCSQGVRERSMPVMPMVPVMIVTGGSQGIGAAVARMAAARGYAVALTYQTNRALADGVVNDIE